MKNIIVLDDNNTINALVETHNTYELQENMVEVSSLPETGLISYLQYDNDTGKFETVQNTESIKIMLAHTIPDENPENGIPEIDGDGSAWTEVTVKIYTGDTYGLESTGEGDWAYEVTKVSDGSEVIDDTYEGKKISINTTAGILNKTEIILDENSQGTFKIKSEARTCVGDNAAVITLTSKDIEDCTGTSMQLEFAPVDF